jgi:hypothetical protein
METNTPWLAIMAIAAAVQSLILLGVAIGAFRLYRLTTTSIERLERETLAPLVTQTRRAVDRFERVVDRVEHADDQIRDTITQTSQRVAHATATVRNRLWPILGVSRGAIAAFSALTAPRLSRPWSASHPASRPKPAVQGRRPAAGEDESRFVYEGGIDHARS